MASFDKYSNYNENTSFSGVVFGAEKPLLEVELNELQQIINTKLSRVIKSVLGGSSFIPLSEDSVEYDKSSKKLTFKDCVAVTDDGLTIYVNNVSISLSTTSYNAIYIQIQEVTKTADDTIKSYGNTSGGNVTNTMKDSRTSDVETSRRKVTTFTIKTGSSVPSDTSTVKNILIGSWNGSTSTFTRNITSKVEKLEKQLNGITLGVENGLVYIDVPDKE